MKQAELAAARSAISKHEDHIRELQLYRDFIYSLSPKVLLPPSITT
jgi:hypothetical protein